MSRNFTPHTISLSIVLAAGLGTALLACSNVLGFKDLAPLADDTLDASDDAMTNDAEAADAASRYVATAVAAGEDHSCAVIQNGQVICWGSDNSGQLGNGIVTGLQSKPVATIGLAAPATALSLGQLHSCAIEVGGAVQCWGGNADGELGSGQYKSGAAPQSVKGLSGPAKSISAGLTHTCAVMAAGGDLYCWGTNRYGELGGGTLGMPSHSAVHVSLPRPTLEVSCGAGYTCAVGDDGSVRCWGQNADSELGYPQTSSLMSPVPVLVDGVKTVTTNLPGHRLAAGTSHTCVLGADSNTHCWGSNGSGELGDGTRNSPEPATKLVPALSLIGVTAGEESSAGVDNNGAIWIWGSRSPSFSVPSLVSPALLPGDIVASSVEMRWSHACAVSNSGAVWCWGQNASGQLGNGTRTASLTPVRVSGF